MRGRVGRGGSRSVRRKFDTSDFYLVDVFSNNGPFVDLVAGWARVPSDVVDTFNDFQVPNNSTLISTRVSYQGYVRKDDDSGACDVFVDAGLIAWPSANSDFVPAELPDVRLPYPWIWRHHEGFTLGASSSALPRIWQWDNNFGPESIIGSKAQRKLPEGMGILFVGQVTVPTNMGTDMITVFRKLAGTMWCKLA